MTKWTLLTNLAGVTLAVGCGLATLWLWGAL